MIAVVGGLLAAWSSQEPFASLLVYVSAILLGSLSFFRLRSHENEQRSFAYVLTAAFLTGVIFIGIAGASFFLLSSSYKTYSPILESLAQGEEYRKDLQVAQEKWGGSISQDGLSVVHTFDHEDVVEVKGPDGKTRYINQTITEIVEQESILSFAGVVDIHLVDSYLNTYEASVDYQYEVVNQSDLETTAHFSYPINLKRIYKNVSITVDGKDVGSEKSLDVGKVTWQLEMLPHQVVKVGISYQTQGMGGYIHTVSKKDAIQNYLFVISTDSRNLYVSTKPDTSAIKQTSENTEAGYRLSWMIERSILAPETGIRFKPGVLPDVSYRHVTQLTRYASRSVMLLLVLFVFTMMICDVKVDMRRLLLLAFTFSMQFLILMGLGMAGVTGWFILPLLFVVTFQLAHLVIRHLPRLSRRLALLAVILFGLAYPYAGLLPNGPSRTAFDAIVQALIILYIFGLSLYIRIRVSLTET